MKVDETYLLSNRCGDKLSRYTSLYYLQSLHTKRDKTEYHSLPRAYKVINYARFSVVGDPETLKIWRLPISDNKLG